MTVFGFEMDSKFGKLEVFGQFGPSDQVETKAAFCGDRRLSRKELKELDADPALLRQASRGFRSLQDHWSYESC